MYRRQANPLLTNSFFLFGARGTGKSTLVKALFEGKSILEIDLLNPAEFEEASFALPELAARVEAAANDKRWIFIDEVQKVPRLLDMVQRLIDKRKAQFILTGSSARKLKRGGANLLAGRAYTYNLYPLLSAELDNDFDLDQYLSFGGLPHIWNITSNHERTIYLRSYITTYLKEEIAEEQIVRKLEPFSRFLQIAAQSTGTIINYSNIARDVGISDQTVKTYFQILEETLIGFTLPAYDQSIRKAQGKAPKFYLFDPGIIRALNRTLNQPLSDANYAYGKLFEHFIVNEVRRRAEYAELDFQYSFLTTTNDQEIDLIVERPGESNVAVEIKSTKNVKEDDTKILSRLGADMKNTELLVLSRDPKAKSYGAVQCVPWQKGIELIVGRTPTRSSANQ